MRIQVILLAAACSACNTASQNALLSNVINQAASQAHLPAGSRTLINSAMREASESSASSSYDQASQTQAADYNTAMNTAPSANAPEEYHDVGPVPLFTDRGALTPLDFDARNLLPKDRTQLVKHKVEAILEHLLKTPALSKLQGFSVDRHIHLDNMEASPGVIGAKSFLLVRRVDPSKSKRDPTSGALRGVGEGPAIEVHVNDLKAVFGYNSVGERDTLGTFHESPVKMRFLHGFPVYERGNKDVVVIAKPGREPFVPVSKQRRLEGLLAFDLERAKELREQLSASQDPRDRTNLEKYLARADAAVSEKQALLNSLSETERREPACPSNKLKGNPFVDCNTKGATHYLAYNPNYFDAAKPKDSVELITIAVVGKRFLNDKAMGTLTRQALEQLDLSSLQASLD